MNTNLENTDTSTPVTNTYPPLFDNNQKTFDQPQYFKAYELPYIYQPGQMY